MARLELKNLTMSHSTIETAVLEQVTAEEVTTLLSRIGVQGSFPVGAGHMQQATAAKGAGQVIALPAGSSAPANGVTNGAAAAAPAKVKDKPAEEAPAKGRKSAKADDEEAPPAKGRKAKQAAEPEEDEEPAPKKRRLAAVQDDDVEPPAPRKSRKAEPEEDEEGDEEDEGGGGGSAPFDLGPLQEAARLREVVQYVMDQGITKTSEIIATCEQIKADVPLLVRVNDIPTRVKAAIGVLKDELAEAQA